MFTIHLRDISPDFAAAWDIEFANAADIEVSCGDIFDVKADAIVSPANSFGYMDGGIDLVYSRYFGWELQEKLQALIVERHFGELPVGQAVVVPTGHASIPFLVSAPTMRVPTSIARTINVYLAFRATLIAVIEYNSNTSSPIESLLVPGLGTGVGEVPPERAARQMKIAYNSIMPGQGSKSRNVGAILSEHQDLLS